MRVATDNNTDYISEWKKIKIENDTLFFEAFGEWRQYKKAKIEYKQQKVVKLFFLEDETIQYLTPINEPINFSMSKDFWIQFRKRKKINCKIK